MLLRQTRSEPILSETNRTGVPTDTDFYLVGGFCIILAMSPQPSATFTNIERTASDVAGGLLALIANTTRTGFAEIPYLLPQWEAAFKSFSSTVDPETRRAKVVELLMSPVYQVKRDEWLWDVTPLHIAITQPKDSVGNEVIAALYTLYPHDALSLVRVGPVEFETTRPSELLKSRRDILSFDHLLRLYSFATTSQSSPQPEFDSPSLDSLTSPEPLLLSDITTSQGRLNLAMTLFRNKNQGHSPDTMQENVFLRSIYATATTDGGNSLDALALLAPVLPHTPKEQQRKLLPIFVKDASSVYLLKAHGIDILQEIDPDDAPLVFVTLRNVDLEQAKSLTAFLLLNAPHLFIPDSDGSIFADKHGDTIFHVLSEKHPAVLESLATQSIELPEPTNARGLTPLGVRLLNASSPSGFSRFVENTGYSFLNGIRSGDYTLGASDETVSAQHLMKKLSPDIAVMKALEFTELKEYFRKTNSLYQIVLYLEALGYLGIRSEDAQEKACLAFYQVVANVLLDPRPPVTSIISKIAARPVKDSHFRYASDAELFLLLNSPHGRAERDQVEIASNILTPYVNRHLDKDSATSIQQLLGQIGTLSHSYEKWRIEAMSLAVRDTDDTTKKLSSLLEYFAFGSDEAALAARSDSAWGGLQIFIPPERMRVIFSDAPELNSSKVAIGIDRRGLLVSSGDGTLFIRNSSPAFGRRRARYCAYVSKEAYDTYGYTERDLREFSFRFFEDLTPLHNAIHGALSLGVSQEGSLRNVERLRRFFDKFNEFKCNTGVSSAWDNVSGDGSGKQELVGLHLSPGFSRYVDHLSQAYFQQERLGATIRLGAYHPDFPAFHPYRFIDNNGKEAAFITVGPEELVALRKLADLRGDKDELERLSLYHFFQNALLANSAELVATISD
jgi:hypothetical protein